MIAPGFSATGIWWVRVANEFGSRVSSRRAGAVTAVPALTVYRNLTSRAVPVQLESEAVK